MNRTRKLLLSVTLILVVALVLVFAVKRQRSFRTVKIGNQIWMAQNLNVKTDSSWCYDDKAENCKRYGRLYKWNAAKHACPEGWHLPSDSEWTVLEDAVGGSRIAGTKLMSSAGWANGGNGTDDYGFTVLPAGDHDGTGSFAGMETTAWFWSAAESDGGKTCYRVFIGGASGLFNGCDHAPSGFSVRCIQNDGSPL